MNQKLVCYIFILGIILFFNVLLAYDDFIHQVNQQYLMNPEELYVKIFQADYLTKNELEQLINLKYQPGDLLFLTVLYIHSSDDFRDFYKIVQTKKEITLIQEYYHVEESLIQSLMNEILLNKTTPFDIQVYKDYDTVLFLLPDLFFQYNTEIEEVPLYYRGGLKVRCLPTDIVSFQVMYNRDVLPIVNTNQNLAFSIQRNEIGFTGDLMIYNFFSFGGGYYYKTGNENYQGQEIQLWGNFNFYKWTIDIYDSMLNEKYNSPDILNTKEDNEINYWDIKLGYSLSSYSTIYISYGNVIYQDHTKDTMVGLSYSRDTDYLYGYSMGYEFWLTSDQNYFHQIAMDYYRYIDYQLILSIGATGALSIQNDSSKFINQPSTVLKKNKENSTSSSIQDSSITSNSDFLFSVYLGMSLKITVF